MEFEVLLDVLLDRLFAKAKAEGSRLSAVIEELQNAQIDKTTDGFVISGVTTGSTSTSFSFVSTGVKTSDVVSALTYLSRLYKIAYSATVIAGGGVPSDQILYNWMIANLDAYLYNREVIDYRNAAF